MIQIRITQDDIDQGAKPYSTDSSPVALALQRATGYRWYVYSTEAIRAIDYARIRLPLIAQHFGWAFNQRLKPLPLIEFTADIPAVGKPVEAAT